MSHKLVYYSRIITTVQRSLVAIPACVILIFFRNNKYDYHENNVR